MRIKVRSRKLNVSPVQVEKKLMDLSKNILLFFRVSAFLALCFSKGSFAVVDSGLHDTVLAVSHHLKQVSEALEPDIPSSCGKKPYVPTYEGCNDDQELELGFIHGKAKTKVERLYLEVSAYEDKGLTRDQSQDLNKIQNVFLCMKEKMNEIIYSCRNASRGCNGRELAFVPGYPMPIMKLLVRKISLCPNFFSVDKTKGVGALVHELSHLCGAEDHVYFVSDGKERKYLSNGIPVFFLGNGDGPYPYSKKVPLYIYKTIRTPGNPKLNRVKTKRVKLSLTHQNADHYNYWVTKGFCLPGFDC